MKESDDYPYPECKLCRTLFDCKHREMAMDDLGAHLPPDNCPKPFAVMRRTTRKLKNKKLREKE